MSKNPNGWREKYLDSLDQRDKLKERSERRQELMRRALVRVSIAAGGQDASLDQDLMRLRASMNSDGKLAIAVDQVEKTILKLEQTTGGASDAAAR